MLKLFRPSQIFSVQAFFLCITLLSCVQGQDNSAADWKRGPDQLEFWGKASSSRVRATLERWLRSRTHCGARVSIESESFYKGRYSIKARASGMNVASVEQSFSVDVVEHPPEKLPAASQVLLSNNPETIRSEGVLYHRRLEASAFRLMWHHRNEVEGPERYIVVRLLNPTAKKRRMRIHWSSQDSSSDAGFAGHNAALQYAEASKQQLSERVELEPFSEITLDVRPVRAGQCSSGLAYFYDESNSSDPVHVILLAGRHGKDLEERHVDKDPYDRASGVFPAEISGDKSHVIGSPYTIIQYGGEPFVRDRDTGSHSRGNYGTVYRTRLTLYNPNSTEAEVVLGFMVAGGPAAGVLRVGSRIYDLPRTKVGDIFEVCRIEIPSAKTKQLDLELIPEAGSYYPVRIVVSSKFQNQRSLFIQPSFPFKRVVR